MVGDPMSDQAALRAADISIGCPSSLEEPPASPEEDAPQDPLHEELLRGPNENISAEEREPLLPAENAAYFESHPLHKQSRSADFTPDIMLDAAGLPSLVALWDTCNAARSRAKQNRWLSIFFLLLFAPASAGLLSFLGAPPLFYPFVAGALLLLMLLLIMNALRE